MVVSVSEDCTLIVWKTQSDNKLIFFTKIILPNNLTTCLIDLLDSRHLLTGDLEGRYKDTFQTNKIGLEFFFF